MRLPWVNGPSPGYPGQTRPLESSESDLNVEASRPSSSSPARKRVVMLILLAAALLAGGYYMINVSTRNDTIIVTFPGGQAIDCEVADTPEKLLFGLAFREALPVDSGMLYIFEASDRHRLWTKGFQFPVDMIWVDEGRRVVHTVERADPCAQDPCPMYGPPPENARYVIQTEAGFVARQQVKPGEELKFTLRL